MAACVHEEPHQLLLRLAYHSKIPANTINSTIHMRHMSYILLATERYCSDILRGKRSCLCASLIRRGTSNKGVRVMLLRKNGRRLRGAGIRGPGVLGAG